MRRALAQRLRPAVRGLHDVGHDLAAALVDELLHPLNCHLVVLLQAQLLLRESGDLLWCNTQTPLNLLCAYL